MTLETKIAEAMAAKRAELIAQPLTRIWPELARVASEIMQDALGEAMARATVTNVGIGGSVAIQ